MIQLILFFQVVAAAVFTPVEEVERRPTRVEKGVKDFFKEEWVDRVSCRFLMTVLVLVVSVGVVVRVTVEGWWRVFRRKQWETCR